MALSVLSERCEGVSFRRIKDSDPNTYFLIVSVTMLGLFAFTGKIMRCTERDNC